MLLAVHFAIKGRIDQSLALCLPLLTGILVSAAAKARPAGSNPADRRCLFR